MDERELNDILITISINNMNPKQKTKNNILDESILNYFKKLQYFSKITREHQTESNSLISNIISSLKIFRYNPEQRIKISKELIGEYIILLGEIIIFRIKKSNQKENSKESNSDTEDELFNIINKGSVIPSEYLNMKKYKIISKRKAIIGFFDEADYQKIFKDLIIKERLDIVSFLYNLNYFPREDSFLQKLEGYLHKKFYYKNSIVFSQNDNFNTFYIIESGGVRISINIKKKFICGLDSEILIGKNKNKRFTSARLYEIKGEYNEKEEFKLLEPCAGEMLGAIEYVKGMKNYLFTAKCIEDTILYEVDKRFFKTVEKDKYINLNRFYEKIQSQVDCIIDRFKKIKQYSVDRKFDYILSQNKFIQSFLIGNPLSKNFDNEEHYINCFVRPFHKIKNYKKVSMANTKFNKSYSMKNINQKFRFKNDNFNNYVNNRINKKTFITNIPKKKKSRRNEDSIKNYSAQTINDLYNNNIKNFLEDTKINKNIVSFQKINNSNMTLPNQSYVQTNIQTNVQNNMLKTAKDSILSAIKKNSILEEQPLPSNQNNSNSNKIIPSNKKNDREILGRNNEYQKINLKKSVTCDEKNTKKNYTKIKILSQKNIKSKKSVSNNTRTSNFFQKQSFFVDKCSNNNIQNNNRFFSLKHHNIVFPNIIKKYHKIKYIVE